MSSEFTYIVPDDKSLLYALRKYLKSINKIEIATLLENASCNISTSSSFSYIRWNAYATTVTFYVPVSKLEYVTSEIRSSLLSAVIDVFPKDAGYDVTEVPISPMLESPGDDTYNEWERYGQTAIPKTGDAFKRQFPAGLPFGLKKPNLALIPTQGTQRAFFENEADIGVIRENVYPNFSYSDLLKNLNNAPVAQPELSQRLLGLCQTDAEKKFILSYASKFMAWDSAVPVLIPQAWIQWHSKTKVNLREDSSGYTDDLYRVDFVAFWNWRRFAILIDDISHYGKLISGRWDASEESYTKRLKEDRKLRREGWQVFRVSNWEIRRENALTEILNDLREYMDFKEPSSYREEIPF